MVKNVYRLFCLIVVSYGLMCRANVDPTELSQRQFQKTLEAEVKANPDNKDAREKLAQIYFRNKSYQKVIETLKGFVLSLSDNSLSRLASSYKHVGDIDKEIHALETLAKLRPKSYKPHMALGYAHLKRLKKPDEGQVLLRKDITFNQEVETMAVKHFREAMELGKKHEAPYQALLNFFLERDNYFESQRLLEEMIEKFGKKGTYYSHLCRIFSVQAFLDQAFKTCSSAIRKDRDNPDNYVYLANTFYDQKEVEKSIKFLSKASKKFPRAFQIHFSLAQKYVALENHLLASQHFHSAVQLEPKHKEAVIGLAESLFQIEKYNEALPFYARACNLDHTYKLRLRVATNTLKQQGKYKFVANYQDEVTACR